MIPGSSAKASASDSKAGVKPSYSSVSSFGAKPKGSSSKAEVTKKKVSVESLASAPGKKDAAAKSSVCCGNSFLVGIGSHREAH